MAENDLPDWAQGMGPGPKAGGGSGGQSGDDGARKTPGNGPQGGHSARPLTTIPGPDKAPKAETKGNVVQDGRRKGRRA